MMDAKTLVLLAVGGALVYFGWKALGQPPAQTDQAAPGDQEQEQPGSDWNDGWNPDYQNPGGGAPGFGYGSFSNPCAIFPSLCRPSTPLGGYEI